MATKKKQPTDKEYILDNLVFGRGLQGPEVKFNFADNYGFSICDCTGRSLRAVKGELTERAVERILELGAEHPIQPSEK